VARHIRTGFFPEDEDYIDPEAPLLAERLSSRWRYMDDPTLRAPVLQRSNVGMGMLVLNRSDGIDLRTINEAYTRLRNLEVNSFIRCVGLTGWDPGPFCPGLNPRELLLAAAATARDGRLPSFSLALLWHQQELAHLVADYRKPLVCQLNGLARNGGAALACLANFSGAHDSSEVAVDACSLGLVPDGGMTHVLGGLRWNLGEFLALTGWPVRGADLVYCELAGHWLSPDALPFLELTAERQLLVSEADALTLIGEHSLPVPEGLREQDSLPARFLPFIEEAFSAESVPKVVEALDKMAHGPGSDFKVEFARECKRRIARSSPLALHATFRLVREAKKGIQLACRGMDVRTSMSLARADLLEQALRLELRVQQRLLRQRDALLGLHAHCLGRELEASQWSRRSVIDVVLEEVDELCLSPLDPNVGESEDFAVAPRSEFPLSQHPRLRRFHPDYDEASGTDHDPVWMAAEARRWSPDLFVVQRRRVVEELLGGRDLSLFGQSRWVRVDPPVSARNGR